MTSLPMAAPEAVMTPPVFGADEKFLLQAFRSFVETADSLERSYGMLRAELARLRGELAQSNAGLARSLEENRTIRQHLDRILDGLPCGVLVIDAGGAIARMNPEARRLVEQLAATALEAESLASFPGELRDLLGSARGSRAEQERCFPEADGTERWLAVRHATVADGGEKNLESESIFILRDVSEARKLIGAREKLRREQALAEMSAVLAHEIRNPLGSLELFAGLLAAAELGPECRGWVEHVQAGLRTLAATVNNVLHFHSLPPLERALTDLGSVLDWAQGFLAPMAREAGLELRVRNGLHGVWLGADRHRLEQVLLNLVLNALRATPEGGRVVIEGALENESGEIVEISVSDTGTGLQPGQADKIFAAGFSTRAGSPGLGLAVCRKIVEQHGGSIRAESQAERGARFTVRFDLCSPPLPRDRRRFPRLAKEGKSGAPAAGSPPALPAGSE